MSSMEKQPEISIIVPVYNMERYMRQCVDSILAQTFENWECLLIDDGSTDKSALICDEYAEKDDRIRVVHKKNGGLSSARNVGVSVAHADLIGFVDSDDWIDVDMYKCLYQSMKENDSDIAVCGIYFDTSKKEISKPVLVEQDVLEGKNALWLILEDKYIPSYAWNKLYKKSLLKDLPFPEILFEDYAVVYKWFARAKKVSLCHAPAYHYRQRGGSIIHNRDAATEYLRFELDKERFDFVCQYKSFSESYKEAYKKQLIKLALRTTKHIARKNMDEAEARHYIERIVADISSFSNDASKMFGMKSQIRLWLLLHHTDVYIAYRRFTGLFAIGPKRRRKKLYE